VKRCPFQFVAQRIHWISSQGELVAEELLAAGRISVPELEKAVVAREIEFRTTLGAELDEALEDHVRALITQMIAEQYLVRVDVGPGVSKTTVAVTESADNTPAKSRGRVSLLSMSRGGHWLTPVTMLETYAQRRRWWRRRGQARHHQTGDQKEQVVGTVKQSQRCV
jgi:hypothetical protein